MLVCLYACTHAPDVLVCVDACAGGEHSVCTLDAYVLACLYSRPHAPDVRKPGTCYVLGVLS